MEHQLYSSIDFKLNLKWVDEFRKNNSSILDVKHSVSQTKTHKVYTTLIQYK